MIKRTFASLLAFSLSFSLFGCSGKTTDELYPDGDKVVATAFGEEITKHQVWASLAAYISNYGLTVDDLSGDDALMEKLKNDFVNDMVLDIVISESAADLGYEFDADENAAFESEYSQFLAQLDENNKSDAETDENISEEEIEQKTEEFRNRYFSALGYDSETYKEYQRRHYITKKVKELKTKDVDIDEEELRKYYDSLMSIQQATSSNSSSGNPLTSTIKLYYPDGYKYVKTLHLSFPASVILNTVQLYSDGEDAKLESTLARETSLMQDKIDEIRAKIDAGESFDTLIAEYGEDDGMTIEPYKTRGYFTPNNDSQAIPSYNEAVGKLQKAGDIAECVTYKGYWFLQAVEIVEEGPAPYEEVKGSLKNDILNEKKAMAWDDITLKLLDECKTSGDVTIDLSVLE